MPLIMPCLLDLGLFMPLISSDPFDFVSEKASRQRWMYTHMLSVWSFGGAESSTCKISYVMVPLMTMTLVMLLKFVTQLQRHNNILSNVMLR